MSRERLPDGTILERDQDGEIIGVYLDEETPLDVLAHRQRRRQKVLAGPRRIDARPAPPRDARRRVCVAVDAQYVDRDTASAQCPICHGALAIRFRGELVDLECCDGCAPGDVEHAVGSVRS